MTACSSASTQEILTESISSVTKLKSGLYDSDVFESTFSSETCTLNHSQTNPTSPLHNSSFLTCANTPNEDVTDEERTSPSHIELADEQYSSPAEVFLNRKLQLLRAKLEPLAETSLIKDNSYSTVQALMLSETSLQEYEKAEKTFAEACLGRLNISECPSVNKSRSPQHIEICTARPLTAQYERLKIESLQHRMETQIKKVSDEIDEHYQAFTCAEYRSWQHHRAEKEFVCHKLKLLTQTKFREKLDKHLYYQMDSLSLLGDIVGSCIRPSAPDSDVWNAMANKMTQLKLDKQRH